MRKETYQKADMGFQILISVAVICNLAAKAIWGRPPVIVPLVGLVVLLISAIGLYICRHETFGVCTQEESQSLWHCGGGDKQAVVRNVGRKVQHNPVGGSHTVGMR